MRGSVQLWTLLIAALAAAHGADAAAESTTPAREPGQPSEPAPEVPENLRNAAWLRDVSFVDARQGWAVGDRGTIWHTDDGGARWRLQASGPACTLRSVYFLDPQRGWAVGGRSQSCLHGSAAVVLLTRDGGSHWTPVPRLVLPALRRVRFFDPREGWALGDSSAMFPGGIFQSRDGGVTWSPLGGGTASGWTAGDFLQPRDGVLCRPGCLALLHGGDMEFTNAELLGLRGPGAVALAGPRLGWLVGQGGMVLCCGEPGTPWRPAVGLPAETAVMDLAAAAVRGPKCWIAGSPGSRVLHTPDAGRTWIAWPTSCRVPLDGLTFADDLHGWAVGALGTILATDDGGRTWRCQRAGGVRAAVLAPVMRHEDVPLELLARLAGNDGWLAVVDVIGRQDVEVASRDASPAGDRATEAALAVGASGSETAWRFPLRQPGLRLSQERIVEGWDRVGDGRSLDELTAYLVRQIRTWRPDVIVIGGPDAHEEPAIGLLTQALLDAAARAADPSALQQQIAAGLEPWQAKKVYGSIRPGGRASIELTTAQLAPRLGRSLADAAAGPRCLLEDQLGGGPSTQGYRLLWSRLSGAETSSPRSDFFTGIATAPAGQSRRSLDAGPVENLAQLQRLAQRQRLIDALLDRAARDPQSGSQLLGQTNDLTRDLPPPAAAATLFRLADVYYRSGRWDMAAETFEHLADDYPDDPLARPALVWLVQYYSSAAAGRRMQEQQSADAKPIKRLDRALETGIRLERTQPDLLAEPTVRFPLAAVCRARNQFRQAERLSAAPAAGPFREAWRACGQGELWLVQPKGEPPKPVLACSKADSRPKLDGRLDEPLWQRAKTAPLQSALHDDAQWPGVVMLAHDAEFLYVGIRCREAPGAKYPPAESARRRDADLADRDRVDLLIDVDRNYAVYYRLTIDYRGWAADSFWGDPTWDPTWHIAARSADGAWTAEAAIPWQALAGGCPAPQTVWAVGIQRTVPGVGFQSWTTPAAIEPLSEGFGYVKFD